MHYAIDAYVLLHIWQNLSQRDEDKSITYIYILGGEVKAIITLLSFLPITVCLPVGEFGVVYKAHLINSKPGLKRKISRQSILSDSTMPDIVAVKTLKG